MSKHRNTSFINYTGRDFNSLRDDLENYARLYYPSIVKNFTDNSFESLMFDIVANVGDQLSFYLDYEANEGVLDTALEFENIRQIGKLHGYKFSGSPIAFGRQFFYVLIPAKTIGEGPDTRYYPIIKAGSEVQGANGNIYVLLEDVHFENSKTPVVVGEVDSSTGIPTFFVAKSSGVIASGRSKSKQITVGDFQKFLKVEFEDEEFSHIVSIIDEQGNKYYEVDSLSENTIYHSIPNRGKTGYQPQSIIRPMIVHRRFVSDFDGQKVTIQFGSSSETKMMEAERLLDPGNFLMKRYGKNYITDYNIDPSMLVNGTDMGIVPTNTNLYISYRANNPLTSNASVGTIQRVLRPLVEFEDKESLDEATMFTIINSIETDNEEPIIGESIDIDKEETRQKIYGTFSAQKRAVTDRDYINVAYSMPPQFGSIKRVSVVSDPRSLKRNINLYVLSEDNEGNLIHSNSIIKENLKMWLGRYNMLNDTIDILDAKIANIGVEFSLLADQTFNKYDILSNAIAKLQGLFRIKMNIGEQFMVTNIYSILRSVDGVLDVSDIKVVSKTGANYSTTFFDIKSQTSSDGRFISVPKNVILELKYPESDIKGRIK